MSWVPGAGRPQHDGPSLESSWDRRRFLQVSLAGVSAPLLAACGGGSGGSGGSGKSLTFVAWGGTHQKNTIETLFKPWADDQGVTIRSDSPTNYAKFRTQVKSGNVQWGVVQGEPFFANQACENGWATKLDFDTIDVSAIDDQFVIDCGVPILQYAFNIAYNTDEYSQDNHPRSWKEFFDTDRFPGKRAFWKYATSTTFEAALMADGVAAEDLYPLDIDRALAKLDTIRDSIVWYETGEQQVQLLASGEAPLAQVWNGRVFQAAQQGRPVANEFNEHFLSYEHVMIPKGFENAGLAQEWMNWFLNAPKAQAKFAEATAYAAPNPKFMDHVDPEVAKALPTFPENEKKRAAVVDYAYYAKRYDDLTKKLNAWVSG